MPEEPTNGRSTKKKAHFTTSEATILALFQKYEPTFIQKGTIPKLGVVPWLMGIPSLLLLRVDWSQK